MQPETILVVDDDKVNRELLSVILKRAGYRVMLSQNGPDALAKGFVTPVDLVLMDVMMPNMDGYEICRRLKQDPRTDDIPVIFLSAKNEATDKIAGLDCGGADYVTKPFDRGEVLARVKDQLRIRHLIQEARERQKRLDRDMHVAARIQHSMLPDQEVSETSDLRWAWRFVPCEEVGGDIFNVLRLDETHYAAYMVDVSEHGIASALVTMSISQMLQPKSDALMRQTCGGSSWGEVMAPLEVVRQLDNQYPFERFDKYFSLVYLLVDALQGKLRYCNAGHPSPFLLRRGRISGELDKGGTVVGLQGILPFEEGEIDLAEGDRVIIYTDGVVEYERSDLDFYGVKRFRATIERSAGDSIDTLLSNVTNDLEAFGKNAPPRDDISILAIEYGRKSGQSIK